MDSQSVFYVDNEGFDTCGCNIGKRLPARVVLGVLSFFGFFVNYMLRVNINVAILDMAESPLAAPPLSRGETCNFHFNSSTHSGGSVHNSSFWRNEQPNFHWTVDEQGLVLGSFYWTYVLALVPGGLLASWIGPKVVFGGANLVSAVACILLPVATRSGYAGVIGVRAIQGLVSGATWPAMHVMASRWIPQHERSRFVTTYYGSAVGTAVTYPLCGVLIDQLGWQSSFYVTGCLGLLWCMFWGCLVYNSPAQHPGISKKERQMIEQLVGPQVCKKQPPIPWRQLAKSLPFWAMVVGNMGAEWTYVIILTYGPMYLKNVHGFGIGMSGLMSGLPNVFRFVVAVMFSWYIDHLLRTKGWTLTNARKLASAAALLGPSLLYILLTHMGCNVSIEILIMSLAVGIGGCASSATLANIVDLAPNFAGVLMALASMLSMGCSLLAPYFVSALVHKEPMSLESWRSVFGITSALGFGSCLFYLGLASGEVQRFNFSHRGRQIIRNGQLVYEKEWKGDNQDACIPLNKL